MAGLCRKSWKLDKITLTSLKHEWKPYSIILPLTAAKGGGGDFDDSASSVQSPVLRWLFFAGKIEKLQSEKRKYKKNNFHYNLGWNFPPSCS